MRVIVAFLRSQASSAAGVVYCESYWANGAVQRYREPRNGRGSLSAEPWADFIAIFGYQRSLPPGDGCFDPKEPLR
jgi:hypothetical protein